VPEEYNDLMLCLEWGITWEEFQNTPDEIIGKMHEYRQAKNHGEERLQAKNQPKK
jgi:hypothetical protein